MMDLSKTVDRINALLEDCDCVLVGAGAGLSTAAGLDYGGKRFTDNFSDFIRKYGFTDMYSSGFYPFESEEKKWAYWARHIYTNNTGMTKMPLYEKLLKLLDGKDYFVITTNVDEQFFKAGFDEKRVFATQGSYRFLQCSRACHDRLYDDTEIVQKMLENTNEELEIPSSLVPVCPVCGGSMDVHLRKDDYFVEDEAWHTQSSAYRDFLAKRRDDKCLMMEFGIGFNTPAIIRFPFDTYLSILSDWNLVRFNKNDLQLAIDYHKTYKLVDVDDFSSYNLPQSLTDRYTPVSYDIELVVDKLLGIM